MAEKQMSHSMLRLLLTVGVLGLGLAAMFHEAFDLEELFEKKMDPVQTQLKKKVGVDANLF